MRLLAPQLLLVLVPAVAALGWRGRASPAAMALRLVVLACLGLALARPVVSWPGGGADVVVVVDRSRSMPAGSEAAALEAIALLESQRGPRDGLAVVSFGRQARLERPASGRGHLGGFSQAVDAEGSELARALNLAQEAVGGGRRGRVLVLSDGRWTGVDPLPEARRLLARGFPVDVRTVARSEGRPDVAVASLEAPSAVAAREPFLLTARLVSTTSTTAQVMLSRGQQVLARTVRQVEPGGTVVAFPELLEAPGLSTYQVRVEAAGDVEPQNDVGQAVVRVEGPRRVLLVTPHHSGALARLLTEAGLSPVVRAPGPLDLQALDGVAAVVLEDVEAGALGEGGLGALGRYVREAGGGLVMTGGRRSFGQGGYRGTAVEVVLPVSLELRQEERRSSLALGILLDSSCSMGATLADGRTKMDLAAEGVVGALSLLNESDEASVHLVDTAPHEVFALRPVGAGLPLDRVARGFSGGGGIYVGAALKAAQGELLRSKKPLRHVLLFSDAADSEEPDDYRDTLAALTEAGVTVSVIGMGGPDEVHAPLLREVAALGRGRAYFAEDVRSLPRIFSQETITVSRASYVEGPVGLEALADLSLLGPLASGAPPGLTAYNVTYLKPQANAGWRTRDEAHAPALAFWQAGAGRAATLAAEVEAEAGGAWKGWEGRRAAVESLVRWVLPPAEGADARARTRLKRGQVEVLLDVGEGPLATPMLTVLDAQGEVVAQELPLRPDGPGRLMGTAALPGPGVYFPLVREGREVVRAPPVAQAASAELELAFPGEATRQLQALARAGGGAERLSLEGAFQGAQADREVPVQGWLVALALVALVVEVYLRRLGTPLQRGLGGRVGAPTAVQPAGPAPPSPVSLTPPPSDDLGDALAEARRKAQGRLKL